MKLRKGFVSNSSSSSFVLVTTKENHDKVYDKLSDFEKAVIKSITFETKVYGIDSIGYETWYDQGSSSYDHLDVDWDEDVPDEYEDEGYYEVIEKYTELLSENKDAVFSHDVDW